MPHILDMPLECLDRIFEYLEGGVHSGRLIRLSRTCKTLSSLLQPRLRRYVVCRAKGDSFERFAEMLERNWDRREEVKRLQMDMRRLAGAGIENVGPLLEIVHANKFKLLFALLANLPALEMFQVYMGEHGEMYPEPLPIVNYFQRLSPALRHFEWAGPADKDFPWEGGIHALLWVLPEQLETLILAGEENGEEDDHERDFYARPALKHLDLRILCPDAMLRKIVDCAERVQVLSLEPNIDDDDGERRFGDGLLMAMLELRAANTHLQTLSIRCCHFLPLDLEPLILPALGSDSPLQLVLDKARLSSASIASLPSNLTWLLLSGCDVDTLALFQYIARGGLPHLEVLWLVSPLRDVSAPKQKGGVRSGPGSLSRRVSEMLFACMAMDAALRHRFGETLQVFRETFEKPTDLQFEAMLQNFAEYRVPLTRLDGTRVIVGTDQGHQSI